MAWIFEKKGIITVQSDQIDEEELMDLAIEAGAEDIKTEDDVYEIITEPDEFEDVKQAIEGKSIAIDSAELTMQPQNTVKVEGKAAETLLKLMDLLEDHDDVSQVYSNFDIDEDVLAALE